MLETCTADQIDKLVAEWLQIDQGRGWTMDRTIKCFDRPSTHWRVP